MVATMIVMTPFVEYVQVQIDYQCLMDRYWLGKVDLV